MAVTVFETREDAFAYLVGPEFDYDLYHMPDVLEAFTAPSPDYGVPGFVPVVHIYDQGDVDWLYHVLDGYRLVLLPEQEDDPQYFRSLQEWPFNVTTGNRVLRGLEGIDLVLVDLTSTLESCGFSPVQGSAPYVRMVAPDQHVAEGWESEPRIADSGESD